MVNDSLGKLTFRNLSKLDAHFVSNNFQGAKHVCKRYMQRHQRFQVPFRPSILIQTKIPPLPPFFFSNQAPKFASGMFLTFRITMRACVFAGRTVVLSALGAAAFMSHTTHSRSADWRSWGSGVCFGMIDCREIFLITQIQSTFIVMGPFDDWSIVHRLGSAGGCNF